MTNKQRSLFIPTDTIYGTSGRFADSCGWLGKSREDQWKCTFYRTFGNKDKDINL